MGEFRPSLPGERRGGRLKGVPNKATADIKALALQHTSAAMAELARLALEAESEAARVAAIKEMFDRAYGKPKQTMDVDATLTISNWMQRALEARSKAE